MILLFGYIFYSKCIERVALDDRKSPAVSLNDGVDYSRQNAAVTVFLVRCYFIFVNQFIAIPIFLYAAVYLYREGKNCFAALIAGLFYIFITSLFILNAQIGFNLPYAVLETIGVILTILSLHFIVKKYLKKAE